MDLLLWRHAEAEMGSDDLARPLTRKGRLQARRISAWLERMAPAQLSGLSIRVSPARRTCQTADALARDYQIDARLAPDADWSALLASAGLPYPRPADHPPHRPDARLWPHDQPPLLIVGHQPTLGLAAAVLLAGQALPWSIRKGSLWWITCRLRDGQAQAVLRHVIDPDSLS